VRRSGRISKEIAIVLSGENTEGRNFSDTTKTLVLSRHGASVLCRHKLIPDQEMFLRAVAANREVEVRICGEIGEREDGHIYGVAFVDPSVDFWEMEFPRAEKLEKDLMPVTLECTGCRQRMTVQFDATEMDVYIVNEGVLRFCKGCLTSTFWKIAAEEAAPGAAAPVAHQSLAETDAQEKPTLQVLPMSEAPAKSPPNRRRERRAKVNMTACIRSSGTPDEIVTCEDISRGGLGFRSIRQYSEKAMIEVAVPYAAGAVAIFVPAQITNVRKLEGGALYRYGAAYIGSSKK
jgi:hypothetical protein